MENNNINSVDALKAAIHDIRGQIDKIDGIVLNLINTRLKLVNKIGRLKRKGGYHIVDSTRENEVLSRLDNLNEGPIETSALLDIFSGIIAASRVIQ